MKLAKRWTNEEALVCADLAKAAPSDVLNPIAWAVATHRAWKKSQNCKHARRAASRDNGAEYRNKVRASRKLNRL
jgi:hypothetical protein